MKKSLSELIDTCDFCDREPPILDEFWTRDWPPGRREHFIELGCLTTGPPADCVSCDACGWGEWEDVIPYTCPDTGRVTYYASCESDGLRKLHPDRLRQWIVHIPGLLRAVLGQVMPDMELAEITPTRVWRLGKLDLSVGRREIFFGRKLHDRDGLDVLRAASVGARAIVLAPDRLPDEDRLDNARPLIVALTRLAEWRNERIEFDLPFLDSEASAFWGEREASQRPVRRKRSERAAVMDALARELKEHLRAAGRYAMDAQDRTGSARLLPRPTRKELARLIGRSTTAVTRCFKDEAATELKLLWDLANDLDGILRWAGAKNCT